MNTDELEVYERVINGREYDGTYIKRIVEKLIKEVRKVQKEAEYLAGCIEWCPDDAPSPGVCFGNGYVDKSECVKCWRKRARKEVSNASS